MIEITQHKAEIDTMTPNLQKVQAIEAYFPHGWLAQIWVGSFVNGFVTIESSPVFKSPVTACHWAMDWQTRV